MEKHDLGHRFRTLVLICLIVPSLLALATHVAMGAGPDFSISINPSALSIKQGASDSSTVTLTSVGGFLGNVNLTSTVSPLSSPDALDLSDKTNIVYTVNNQSDTLSIFDGGTNALIKTIAVGAFPESVRVNSNTNKIYVTNQLSGSVSVVDGFTNTVVATVLVGNSPRGTRVNNVTNMIYLANFQSGTVSAINGTTNQVTNINVGASPRAVGINTVTNRVFVTNEGSNSVSVINGLTNTVIATIPVGMSPRRVGVNSVTNRIYISNRNENSVSVIDGSTNIVLTKITVGIGTHPDHMGVNSATNKIYVLNYASNNVSVIDGATNTVIATIGVGTGPHRISINSNTNRIHIANLLSNSISIIDGATNTLITSVGVGSFPNDIRMNFATNKLYVANMKADSVSIIDGSSNSVTATFGIRFTVQANPSIVVLTAGGTSTSVMTMFTFQGSPLGVWSIILTASSGALSHSVTETLNITQASHDVGVSLLVLSKNFAYNSVAAKPVQVNVTAINLGSVPEIFAVYARANSTLIGNQTISIIAGGSLVVSFNWDTQFLARGNYLLTANATRVAGETNFSNNQLSGGIFSERLRGDVNEDCKVDILDLGMITGGLGQTFGVGDPRLWRPAADLNNDGVINILDLGIVTGYLGHTCQTG